MLKADLSHRVNGDYEALYSKIDERLISRALKKLKPKKKDSVFDCVSDCYLNAPDNLLTHLANLVRLFVTHGSVPHVVLLCTLIPLIKDGLGDISSSSNYRAIAGGCLLLKLLDIIILILEGDKLQCSELQFAYQSMSSTITCSWTATAVIEYFNRNNSAVYGAAMDMTKAFDMVEWVELFSTLQKRNVNSVVLRLMLYIYENQSCSVKWSGVTSEWFKVSNGVRQGAVSSAILFAVYIDELLVLLKKSRLGCHIDSVFVGAFLFADDILLLSASRAGLQSLVNICHKFARRKNLKFGTHTVPSKSKTKCIVFFKKHRDWSKLAPIMLDGRALPWVKKVNHLGCILDADGSMKSDILSKRGQFVAKVNSLLQEFHFVETSILFKLINSYATSFYGSLLWNLQSKNCEKLFNAWSVAVRNVMKVDRKTHRHLIESLSGYPHIKTVLYARYVKFYQSMINSPKFSIRFLARLFEKDKRSVLGKTLRHTLDVCNLNSRNIDHLTPSLVKRKMEYVRTPAGHEWVADMAQELINVRDSKIEVHGFMTDEIIDMLDFVCTF